MLLKKTAEMVTIIDPDTGKEKEISGAELITGNDGIVDRSYYDKLVNDALNLFLNTVIMNGLYLKIRIFLKKNHYRIL